jgi:ABC-type Fe3+-hydroxamate transport system substrate-binding protein
VHDDLGCAVPVPAVVRRVVSIVPSLTESVAVTAPGLLVGATDWCSHPGDLDVTRVRGTKNPAVDRILALEPDLVLANAEENRAEDLDALRAAGMAVWVTYPRTVPEALDSLGRLLTACRLDRPFWLEEAAAAWAEPFTGVRRRAIIPIWRRPWMAVGSGTFSGDLLARLGIDNVLADHEERYPKIDPTKLPEHDLVVLPDEPYLFTPTDGPEAFAAPSLCVSGRFLTWYGPSLVEAHAVLRRQLMTSAGF